MGLQNYPYFYDSAWSVETDQSGTGTFNLGINGADYQPAGSSLVDVAIARDLYAGYGTGAGTRVYYKITDPITGAWEVGLGTESSGDLTRDRVLSSSNGNTLVDFATGQKHVQLTLPSLLVQNLLQPTHNLIINGGFDYFQRQTPTTATPQPHDTYKGPDRWYVLCERQPPYSGKTITTTGAGTTRTATVTGGSVFNSGDVGGYITTPTGFYIISAYTSATVVSITTLAGYVNETAVAFTVAGVTSERSTGASFSRYGIKLIQKYQTAQRVALVQIVEADATIPMRNRHWHSANMLKCSASQAIRKNALAWTGTADVVTSDVVNSWSNTDFDTLGQFFKSSSMTQIGFSEAVTPTAATWTRLEQNGYYGKYNAGAGGQVANQIPITANNLIIIYWSETTLAQGATLEFTEAGFYEGTEPRIWLPRPASMELQLCQRRFCKSYTVDAAPGTSEALANAGTMRAITAGIAVGSNMLPVAMAGVPTFTTYRLGNGTVNDIRNTSTGTAHTTTGATGGPRQLGAITTSGVAPNALTVGDTHDFAWTAENEL